MQVLRHVTIHISFAIRKAFVKVSSQPAIVMTEAGPAPSFLTPDPKGFSSLTLTNAVFSLKQQQKQTKKNQTFFDPAIPFLLPGSCLNPVWHCGRTDFGVRPGLKTNPL